MSKRWPFTFSSDGRWKVELHQLVGLAGQVDRVFAHFDLYRVAVVDDAEGRGPIAEFDLLQINLDAIPNVDRRLPFARWRSLFFGSSFDQFSGPPSPS
jgi:hypothetical protein